MERALVFRQGYYEARNSNSLSHLVTGSVVGIQLPEPSKLSDTTVCQSTLVSSATPATTATTVFSGPPSTLPTLNTELPRLMPAPPPVLLEATTALQEAPISEALSVLPEAPTAKVPSMLPETPIVNQTLQAPSISASQAASILPPVPTVVSQASILTLRISPSGIKIFASHTDSDSKNICSMNGKPDSARNLPLQSDSFALLQLPEQTDVSGSTVTENVSLDVKNTDKKDQFSVVQLEEKASSLQELEVTMPETKQKENKLPAKQPDSCFEEITDNRNAISSELPEKDIEIMEPLSTEFQPNTIPSSDHTFMSEKSKCEEIKMSSKMKQHAKHPKGISGEAPYNSVCEESGQIVVLAESTLQEQKHIRQLKSPNEEEADSVQTQSPAANSEEAEHLEGGIEQSQKQLDEQKVHMNSTEKLQEKTKYSPRGNQDLELLEMDTKEKYYSLATQWDQKESEEIPVVSGAKDQNNAVETKHTSYAQKGLHKRNTGFQENCEASNNKKGTTDALEKNRIAKDSLVQIGRTRTKISRQAVALESKNGIDVDEHVEKCLEQNTVKTSHKRKDSTLIIDITMDDTEKYGKTDDSADEMVDEVSGYQSEDIVNVETLVSI